MGGTVNTQNARSLEKFAAPLGGEVELPELSFDGGVNLLRIRIRQGTRFTDLDLDPVTAARWGAAEGPWGSASFCAESLWDRRIGRARWQWWGCLADWVAQPRRSTACIAKPQWRFCRPSPVRR